MNVFERLMGKPGEVVSNDGLHMRFMVCTVELLDKIEQQLVRLTALVESAQPSQEEKDLLESVLSAQAEVEELNKQALKMALLKERAHAATCPYCGDYTKDKGQ